MANRNQSTEDKAIEYVIAFEKRAGRSPQDVRKSRNHRGYDVASNERMIEVKGVRESWRSYNWVPLHKTSVERLGQDPTNFYLYVVKFVGHESDEMEALYIIPGQELLDQRTFRIREETYRLTPISKTSLVPYRQSH